MSAPGQASITRDEHVGYLLRLGDTALILGQQLGALCGHAPVLEEDMAQANIALDLIGQARMLLTHAGEVEGKGRDEDRLAFHREGHEFRNLLLAEQPNGDFALTMGRHFLVDAFHVELYAALAASRDERLAAIAAKAVKEATYHLRHSAGWVIRLGDGTAESHARMQAAIDRLWVWTGEMFQGDSVDEAIAAAGIGPDPATLRAGWLRRIEAVLGEATLSRPADGWMQSGGKQGRHTEALSYILGEMQILPRSNPGAVW